MSAKFKGKDFLLMHGVAGSPATYTTIAGLKTNSMTVNNSAVDVTDKSGAPFRELLAGAGIQTVSMKAQGVATDAAAYALIKAAVMANTLELFKLVNGRGDTFVGTFQLTSMDLAGEYSKEETFSLSLESSLQVVYTPGV